MKILIIFIKFVFILFFSLQLTAFPQEKDSDKFLIDGNIRYRFENWNGMNMLNFGDDSENALGSLKDNLLLQRIIFGFKYRSSKNLTFSFHIQDSRAFGWSLRNSLLPDAFKISPTGKTNPYYKMNPNEVYFEIYDFNFLVTKLLNNIDFIIGRQKISLSDYRIFGPGDWGNSGRWTWDALRGSYKSDKLDLDFWIGGTRTNYPDRTTLPFTYDEYFGGGIYGTYKLVKDLTIEPYFARKQQGNADYVKDLSINRNWIGVRFAHNNFLNTIAEGNYVREFGRENGKSIRAFGLFLKLGYQVKLMENLFILSLRYSYASGGNKNDPIIQTFDPVYGASDKYYGWMNLVKWSNLDDREIVFEVFKQKSLWVEIKYNQFRIPSPETAVINGTLKLKPGSNYLGSEFDIYTKYNWKDFLQFVLAFGYFNPGDVQPINNKIPDPALMFSFQLLYNFSYELRF